MAAVLIILSLCKLAYQANLHKDKRIMNWQPFMNNVYYISFTYPGSALCKIMQCKIYHFKFKNGELLLGFHAQSDHQTKAAVWAAHSFNSKSKKKRLKANITPTPRWGHHFFGRYLHVSSGGDSEKIQANKRLYIYDVYFWNSNVFVNGCIYMYVYILVCTPRCLWKEASGWKLTQMPEEKRSCEVCVPALLSPQHSMTPL